MREIKFRAWDNTNKRWARISSIWYNLLNGNIRTFQHVNGTMIKPKYDYIIMQYTGLKDLNNKEIYEGDIVLHKNGFSYIVTWCDINAWWYLHQIRKYEEKIAYTGGISGQDIWRCEIIGNIYESPELV